MFRHKRETPSPREINFSPDDPIYQLYRQTRNPFLERAIAPPAKKLERSGKELKNLIRFFQDRKGYHVSPVNTASPHSRRYLQHPPPPDTHSPKYVQPETLKGDLVNLPWMIDIFFKAVIERLRSNPGEFKAAVEELMEQFQQDHIRIKIYEAYRSFQDWEDLMDTLDEITRYPSPETFDLFCSALFAYYELAFPTSAD